MCGDRAVAGVGAGCLVPSPRVCLRWWGGGTGDESLAAASNGSRWLCQEPGAPPGWGCPPSPPPALVSEPWLRGSMRQGRPIAWGHRPIVP